MLVVFTALFLRIIFFLYELRLVVSPAMLQEALNFPRLKMVYTLIQGISSLSIKFRPNLFSRSTWLNHKYPNIQTYTLFEFIGTPLNGNIVAQSDAISSM